MRGGNPVLVLFKWCVDDEKLWIIRDEGPDFFFGEFILRQIVHE